MKCIIIEDEEPAQQLLTKYIAQTPGMECIEIYDSIVGIAPKTLGDSDLIFLDIQLPGANGIEFLKNLEVKPIIIITTAYRDYAVDAFEEAVDDYLLKPFSYQRFLKAMMRAQNKLANKKATIKNDLLFVYADKTFYKIRKAEILFLKSEVDYVYFYYQNNKLLVQDTMNNWEKELKNDGFVRVHRSFLINPNKIEKVEGNQILIGEHKIPIGVTYKKDFMQLLRSH
ncbi:LytTR family DNA-binding domain-containing protein [Muricauda sp. 2012CJ35-5]|uniref:LytTR family DNA-binding domain-containing protein n=1 Tax=Flagellimonas spongiicola TaxID=2942208 RepID=A0ABT0PTG0_9FLAO|nr:LytTR family DNA-binding domain-containing protein [Allomuricauda spongiicola]MCL6274680.1 LytTR family DNA-binding domain-containing protein [Allomuricauda spongiicola]